MAELAAVGWLWLLPGGGQFALGQTAAGLAYAAGSAGLAGWGIAAETRRGPGELNAPLVYAQQLYVVSWYAADRDRVEALGGDTRRDPAPVGELARAPLAPSALTDPWVLGFAAAGGGAAWWMARIPGAGSPASRVTRMTFLGGRFHAEQAPWAFAGYWVPLSYGAGLAEESLFRGTIEPALASLWGDGAALGATAAAFGLAHLTPPFGRDAWEQAGFATVAGLYLGWRWQRDGYRLRGPIAAHAWFDVLAGLGAYLADPRQNPLGATVELTW